MATSPNPDENVFVILDTDGETPISDPFDLMSEALAWMAGRITNPNWFATNPGPNYIIQRRRGCLACAHAWGAPDDHPIHLEPCEPGCVDGWIPDED